MDDEGDGGVSQTEDIEEKQQGDNTGTGSDDGVEKRAVEVDEDCGEAEYSEVDSDTDERDRDVEDEGSADVEDEGDGDVEDDVEDEGSREDEDEEDGERIVKDGDTVVESGSR